ncbi:MAG: electron transfer flavoprotein subunit alpha/FixB family protein [Saprospiraceae bacterium]|nr:electron transfer flavoprotein subunit alpha/FixB family protein [Saprospiraceae bacterium]
MILVLIEVQNNDVKKSSLEALSFASQLASLQNDSVCALTIGTLESSINLGQYGADENIIIPSLEIENDQIEYILRSIALEKNPSHIILSLNSTGKNLAAVLAAKLNFALLSGVTGVHLNESELVFSKTVFSGKAKALYSIVQGSSVIAIMPNSISINNQINKNCTTTTKNLDIPGSRIKTLEKRMISGKTPLTEASVVVSAGRGLKDPSNWQMIEELAELLGASTACSRPVADIGWRPHHEHVGQTGIAIRPNVYIAIGISGAIQHLAGVNNSRKIIVINKDPEAPFFAAADYGICGDLFEVIPKLNETLKKIKSNS